MYTLLSSTETALAKRLFLDQGGNMKEANKTGGNIFWIMFMRRMGY